MLRNRLLQLPRQSKRALQVFADILLLWAALWLAFLVRLGLAGMIDPFGEYLWLFLAAPATAIPLFVRFGLYRAVLRYFGKGNIKSVYLPEVLVKMRVGGVSNRDLGKMIEKSGEDLRALRSNGVGGFGALAAKNLSKLPQFILKSRG